MEENNLAIVASGYDMSCDCGHQWDCIQLTDLKWDDAYIVECPDCHTVHRVDPSEIGHAI